MASLNVNDEKQDQKEETKTCVADEDPEVSDCSEHSEHSEHECDDSEHDEEEKAEVVEKELPPSPKPIKKARKPNPWLVYYKSEKCKRKYKTLNNRDKMRACAESYRRKKEKEKRRETRRQRNKK